MQEPLTRSDDSHILEKCREIELLSKKLYLFFADLYADDAVIKALWIKTADEEQHHADQFTLALKMKKSLSVTLHIDMQKAVFVVGELEKLIKRYEVNPPKLVDALSTAIKLENYLVDLHLVCVASFEDQSFKNMFSAMMAADQQHVARLEDALNSINRY
jgi:rubrerythrin